MKVLYKNRWVEVHELSHVMPDGSVNPYTSVKDGTGASVAVMPFRYVKRSLRDPVIEVLLRREIVPPWLVDSGDPEERILSSLTGMMDHEGENPVDTAVREVYEESGYRVTSDDMLSLGTVHLSKVLESRTHLFAVDVTDLIPDEAPGDGAGFEEWAESVWCLDMNASPDALALALRYRLQRRGYY